MVINAWIKNVTTRGKNAGLKRIRVQSGTWSDTAANRKNNHIEFVKPEDEASVLQKFADQYGVIQCYRQSPQGDTFPKAEQVHARKNVKVTPPDATMRGQGTTCRGQLTITLTGPQGCGKSLVAKMLKTLLPLSPVSAVVIETRTTV